jgi:hypothetical protein
VINTSPFTRSRTIASTRTASRDFKVVSTSTGYVVELALQIYGAKLENGTSFGVDVMISDSTAPGVACTARVYRSHNDSNYSASPALPGRATTCSGFLSLLASCSATSLISHTQKQPPNTPKTVGVYP